MISRAIAVFLGAFTLANLLGSLVTRHFDCNIWWIDLRPLPAPLAACLLVLASILLLMHGFYRPVVRGQRQAARWVLSLLAVFALANALRYYQLLLHHRIATSMPIPLSALLCALLGWLAWRSGGDRSRTAKHPRLTFGATLAACFVALPLTQMFFFGRTDYRRPADVAVVFGARTYADGHPSLALADRVQTACSLYHEGLVPRLLFSGGPGEGSVSEPQAMRQLALKLGVPDSAIVLDEEGLNTEATVRNTQVLCRQIGARRVLAVSHGYHLPRVKTAFRRAGQEVYTVPATEFRPLARMPLLVAREVAATWAYYLAPLRPVRR